MSDYTSDLLIQTLQTPIDKQDIAIGVFPVVPEPTAINTVTTDNQDTRPIAVQLQDTNQSIPVIYGIRSVEPILVNANLDTTGLKLTMAYVVCEGEVNGFFRLKLDDAYHTFGSTLNNAVATAVTGPYAGYVRAELRTGTLSGAAATLVAGPYGNTKYEGLCMLFLELRRDSVSGGPFTELPEVKIEVFGRKVLDVDNISNPRAYSTNPADIIYDYLTNAYFGKGIATASVNIASFQSAKDKYAELIAPYAGQATTLALQTMNILIDTQDTIRNNIDKMVGSVNSRLVYASGQYFLVVLDSGDTTALGTTAQVQAQFTTATVFSDVAVQYGGKDTRFNSVIARYDDIDAGFVERQIAFPVVTVTNSYLTEDKNESLVQEIYLPGVIDAYRARNMAQHVLLKSRRSAKVSFTATKEAWKLLPGDIIDLTWDLPAFSNTLLRITEMSWSNGLVQIEAEVHATSNYMPFSLLRRIAPPIQPLLPGQGLVGNSGIIQPDTPFGLLPPTAAPSPGDPGTPSTPAVPNLPNTPSATNVINIGALSALTGTGGQVAFGNWLATNNTSTTTTTWARTGGATNSANTAMRIEPQSIGRAMIEGYGRSPTALAGPSSEHRYNNSTPIKIWRFGININSLNSLYFFPGRYIGVQWKLASEPESRFRSSTIGRTSGAQAEVVNYFWNPQNYGRQTVIKERFLGSGFGLSLESTQRTSTEVPPGYHQGGQVSGKFYRYYDINGILQTAQLEGTWVPLPYVEQCEYSAAMDYFGIGLPSNQTQVDQNRRAFMPVFNRDAKSSGLTLRFYTYNVNSAFTAINSVQLLGDSSYNFTWDRTTTNTSIDTGIVLDRTYWARLYPADATLWTSKS